MENSTSRWRRDWQTWHDRPETTAAITRWRRRPPLADITDLHSALLATGHDRAVPIEVADQRLAAVVAEAMGGCVPAGRLAVQRVLPALVNRAKVRSHQFQLDFDPVLDDLLGAAWMVVRGFPLDRRPIKIAINIIRDAEAHVFGYQSVVARRTLLADQSTVDLIADSRHRSVPDEPLQLLLAGLPEADARLLTQYEAGMTALEIADLEGITDRGVRVRRRAALARLKALWSDVVDRGTPCRACGAPVIYSGAGPRTAVFCSGICRSRHRRQREAYART